MQPSQILDPVGRDFQMCQGHAKEVQSWHQLMMISLWGHFQVSWLPATRLIGGTPPKDTVSHFKAL